MNLLYALFALDILNLAVFLPVFGAFIRSLGGTLFNLGLINSSSALVSFLWNPIVGSLSDQVGRKGLLLKCLLASSVGSLILAVSSSSLLLVFLGRIIGAFGSPTAILLRSIVADSYKTAEDKKVFFNKCAPFMSVAFLCGTLSSGFLSEAKNGFVMAFLLMAAITGFSAFIANRTITNDVKTKAENEENSSFASKASQELKSAVVNIRTISWPRYKHIFYIKGFYDFSLAMIFPNVGLTLLSEFDVKGRTVGYVFMMTSVCRIVSNILKLKLKNVLSKLSDNSKVIIGVGALVISSLIMGLSSSLSVFLTSLCIICTARAFMETIFTEIIATRTTEGDRGKVIGAYDNLFPFAMFVGPLISGVMAEALGQRILISCAAIPAAMSVFVAYRNTPKTD